MRARRAWRALGQPPWPAAVGLGVAAGVVAWSSPDAALAAPAAVAAAAVLAAAARWPGAVLAVLMGLIVAQDALVAAGLGLAQQADEAILVVLMLVAAARAVGVPRVGPATAGAGAPPSPGPVAPWDGALLAFGAAASAAALWNAVPPLVAALGILAVTKGALAASAAARIPFGPRAARRAADAAAALVAASGAVAVVQRLGGPAAFQATGQAAHLAVWHGAKAPGLFAHHNALAHAAVLAGAWWLGRRAAGLPAGPAVRVAEAATLAGLVASASREGWLAALAAIAAVAWMAGSAPDGARIASSPWTVPRRIGPRAALAALAAVLAVAAVASYGGSPVLRAEMARRLEGVPGGWRAFDLGLTDWAFRGEYRVYVLRKSLEVWADHPLLGTGPGRFGGAVAERFGSPVYETYGFLPLDGRFAPLDLFWARLPAELGLLGAAAFVVLLARGARSAAAARRSDEAVARALSVGAGGAWAAALVLAAFAPSFEEPLVAIPLWLWTAAAWRSGRGEGPAARGRPAGAGGAGAA